MNDLEFGWLCGIIDGEGCFTIRIHFGKTKHLGIRPRFQPQLIICNTVKTLIDRTENIFKELDIPYGLSLKRRSLKNPNHKDIWHILIFSKGLRKLIPLINGKIVKQRELELMDEVLNKKRKHGSNEPFTNKELLDMDKLRQELISLHGNQAKKLSVNMASKCSISDNKIEEYKKERKEHAKIMVRNRYINKGKIYNVVILK